MKILLVTQYNESAVPYFRLLMPHAYMDKFYPGEYDFHQVRGSKTEDFAQLTDEQLKEFQITYFQREINPQGTGVKMIERCKALGLKVILDVDDYWQLPKWHPMYKAYDYYGIAHIQIDNIKAADHVTTTNTRLADEVRKYNPNVTVLENCIDKTNPQYEPKPTASGRLRFGWIGGVFHYEDIAPLRRSFEKMYSDKTIKNKWQIYSTFNNNDEYKAIERVITCDYKKLDYEYECYLKRFTDQNEYMHWHEPYVRLWGKSIHEYAGMYNNFDVALVPLRDNLFNNCKSELKVIEAAHMGKAVIVSDSAVYSTICHIKNSITVPQSEPHKGWHKAMKAYIESPVMLNDHRNLLMEEVNSKYDIDKISVKRKQLYTWLVSA